jgi:hypothetical protein
MGTIYPANGVRTLPVDTNLESDSNDHVFTRDLSTSEILTLVLMELRTMNLQLSIMTGEELTEEDLEL